MKDTRERILQVALDLFIEQGYDKTSLREVAEKVGVTKAALYYHFSSKEEILRTLIQPAFTALGELADLLKDKPTRETWAAGLTALVDWILPQRRLYELIESNQSALSTLTRDLESFDAHRVMHERLTAILSDEATPLDDRVRMAGCLGFITSVLGFPAGNAFWRVPVDQLKPLLIDGIRSVLRVG